MEFTNFKIVEQSLKDQVSGVKGKASSAIKKGAWRIFSSIIRFIVTNPYALAITIAIIGGTIAYTIYSIDYQLTSIMEQYQALSAKPLNSKSGYDKRVMYVSTDSNGKPVLTVGYRSELEAEEVQQALEEAGVTDVASNTTTVNKTDTYIEFEWPMTLYYLHNDGTLVESKCEKYYGLGKEQTGDWYLADRWKYKQKELWDKIHNDVDNSNIYPTYDGLPLTAMAPYFGNDIGQVVIVTYSNGDEVPMLIVDAKGTGDPYPKWPNASAWDTKEKTNYLGHFYVEYGKLAITEFICNSGQGFSAFNAQFGTHLDGSCTIIKITKGDKNYLD